MTRMIRGARRPRQEFEQLDYIALARQAFVKHRSTFEALAAYDRGEYVVGQGYKTRQPAPDSVEHVAD